MSWKVATLCAERRFGSPARKQIIMYLADKASDDGSGIWCSKGTGHSGVEILKKYGGLVRQKVLATRAQKARDDKEPNEPET